MSRRIDPRLWRIGMGFVAAALAASLALIGALALGWNSPRPSRPPDWEDPTSPRRLEAASNETTLSLLDHPSSDFTFETVAGPVDGPDSGFYGCGLIYRADGIEHYYVFAVGGDGYYAVLQVEGDKRTTLVEWQQFPHIRRGGQANRLRVACSGATCRFTINDEHAATVEDETRLAGDLGLWVRGFDEKVVVEFRSARVWKKSVSTGSGGWSEDPPGRPSDCSGPPPCYNRARISVGWHLIEDSTEETGFFKMHMELTPHFRLETNWFVGLPH